MEIVTTFIVGVPEHCASTSVIQYLQIGSPAVSSMSIKFG